MGSLERQLQKLHDAGKQLEIAWLWDGGVDVTAGDRVETFASVAEVLPWLRHWYGLGGEASGPDALETELQRIYDSEINVTVRLSGDRVFVALGNEFTGFAVEGDVEAVSDVLGWLQGAIARQYAESKYNVERLGGTWTPKWFGPTDYTVDHELMRRIEERGK